MKPIRLLAAAVATFASLSSSAAILTLDGPSTATPGQTILLTATGSTGVGPADVAATTAGGGILYTDAFVNTNVPGSSQNLIPGMGLVGVLDCTLARCRAFNQVGVLGNPPFVPAVTDFLISSTSFIIDPTTPLGTVVTFRWMTTPASNGLNFFGALASPDVIVTIVPDPTTAALLCVGFAGLAIARRSSRNLYRSIFAWVTAAFLAFDAGTADAATITLAGPSTATPGQTILLTATGSTGVGPADVPAVNAGGRILYTDAFVNTNVPGSSQNLIPGMGGLGVLDCTTTYCRGFNQIGVLGNPAFVPALTDFLISSTSFIIDPTAPFGTVLNFNWTTTPASSGLNFFGAVAGPALTVTVVPEPTTAALLCVGLAGLAIAGRKTEARPA